VRQRQDRQHRGKTPLLRDGVVMADRFPNFAALAESEESGIDYRVVVRRARPAFAIIAPHGGAIEPGTSEIADAIAGAQHSFYSFEGLKSAGNGDLHITSTRFDEPMCLSLLTCSAVVLTVHGEQSEGEGEGVFIGGLDETLAAQIGAALAGQGFAVRKHQDPGLQGREPKNVCNRGTARAGVQLELSRTVRRTLFESLTGESDRKPTARFSVFVNAVNQVLR
jgi:phage replication-related protein YjqB (UPF0714/DUF867 family)